MININQATNLYNGAAISLLSVKTKSYVALDSNDYTFNLNGVHPSLENKHCKTLLKNHIKYYLFKYDNPNDDRIPILYGDSVCIMTQEEYFLCASNTGYIVLERLTDNVMTSDTLPPNSRLTIHNGLNIETEGKPISYDEDVVFKTNFGYFFMVENPSEEFMNHSPFHCSGSMISEETLFKAINSEMPYIPDWCNKRKYINFNYTNIFYNSLENSNQAKGFTPINKSKSKYEDKLNLMSKSKDSQEVSLLEDLLLNLIGFEGEYIKRDLNNLHLSSDLHNSHDPISFELEDKIKDFCKKFKIEPYLENPTCDASLSFIINRILPISFYYDKICLFINLSNKKESGVIVKAFSESLKHILKEYIIMINDFEVEYFSGSLDIQHMWYLCQKPLKMLENIYKLTKNSYFIKGGNLINVIYSFYKNTADEELKQVYKNLLEKTFSPYIDMLINWLCSGYLDDIFNEFMVSINPFFKKENLDENYNELYWEKKYSLNEINIPIFLNKISEEIFFIGKAIILIKDCGKIIKCPYEKELDCFIFSNNLSTNKTKIDNRLKPFLSIIDNLDNLHIFNQLILKLHSWANSSLLEMTLIEGKLLYLLNTTKKLYFLECGDFYSYFLDLADDYLNQDKSNIEYEKIENLFFTAQNSTSMSGIKNKDKFTFCYSSMTIQKEKLYLDQLIKINKNKDLFQIITEIHTLNETKELNEAEDIKILESLSIDLNIKDNLLLNIIFSDQNRLKYKLIFRQLILLKYQEKKLGETWIYQQNFVNNNILSYLKPSFLLRDKMINFIKSISHYLFFDIIQSNYNTFIRKIESSNSFSNILIEHDNFLNKCMKESFLCDNDLMINITSLIQSCLVFSNLIIKFYKTALSDENLVRKKEIRIKSTRVKNSNTTDEDKIIENIFLSAALMKTVDQLNDRFEDLLESFMDKISKLALKSEEHLGVLLSKIDFNNYYYERFTKKKCFL